MEEAVRVFAIINLLVIGLSHMIQPRAWADFFDLLGSKGTSGAIINGFISLGMGSIVVAFHNVWTGIPVLLTVYGWMLVLKSLVTFVKPSYGLRGIQSAQVGTPKKFIVPGVFLATLALLLASDLVARSLQ